MPKRFSLLTATILTTVLAPTGLVACSQNTAEPPMRIAQRNWQVTAIFVDPQSPTNIPESVSPRPEMTFGESSATGSTGCARFQALVSYHRTAGNSGEDAEENTTIREANRVKVEKIKMDEPNEGCAGTSAWAHENLSGMLTEGAEFDIAFGTSEQLSLTLVDDRVDSPALRLSAL